MSLVSLFCPDGLPILWGMLCIRVVERDRFESVFVMVWGDISYGVKSHGSL